jgi:hypothetical protein
MVVLADDGSYNIIGQLDSSFSAPLNPPTIELNVLDFIKTDLSPYFSNPNLRGFAIGWRLGLYSAIFAPHETFRSALPKYDIGTVCFTNSGAMISELRWNYQSQFFPIYATQYSYSSLRYPAPPEFCEGIDPNPFLIISAQSNGCVDFADNAYVSLNGSTISNATVAHICYQAYGFTDDFPVVQQSIVFVPDL